MHKRTLQIDVKGPMPDSPDIFRCVLSVDGRDITIYMGKSNYDALVFDGVFIRDGKERDSAGIINTTNTFKEQ